MTAEQRRQEILTLLEQTDTPLSAAALAHRFSVSRQIVVGDVALLRAQQSHVPHDDLAADGKPVRQRRRAERCVRLLQKGQNLLSALLRRHGCRLLTEK